MREPSRLLTAAQREALGHVDEAARRDRDRHRARIDAALAAATIAIDTDALLAGLRRARVTINFHPDRLLADRRSVAAALHDEGVYRSQFETRISNGGLTAFLGGDRDRWEERLFGGAYQRWHVTSAERPKYGGLDLLGYSNGACPRFGSCHLRLRPDVLERTTLALGDSSTQPSDLGTHDALEPVLAGLVEQTAALGTTLGRAGIDLAALATGLTGDGFPRRHNRLLDDSIEAHVHGELRLARDCEALVIDPSFRGTPVGAQLEALAARHRLALDSHAGSQLPLDEIPDDFRGPTMPALARRVAERVSRAHIDAATIGAAAASVVEQPAQWADFESPADALQHIKYLWHILVAFGRPADTVAG